MSEKLKINSTSIRPRRRLSLLSHIELEGLMEGYVAYTYRELTDEEFATFLAQMKSREGQQMVDAVLEASGYADLRAEQARRVEAGDNKLLGIGISDGGVGRVAVMP